MSNSGSVQGPEPDYSLHTIGWKAFQDLCAEVASVALNRTVEIYRAAQDGGRDAAFLGTWKTSPQDGEPLTSTIQCKFTSSAQRSLKLSDITGEKESIVDLVSSGKADGYSLITNMGMSGPVAQEVGDWLRALGVKYPHVLGKEWITRQIKSDLRLRALVPRVYGLGDLSWILDDRKIEQSKEVLAYLGDELKVYVPTEAHRRSVRSLLDHHFVLLLGEPASGKSMIAAILAATALDQASLTKSEAQIVRVTDPIDIEKNWNPKEKGRFFWVDDAFGSNQFRKNYAEIWNRLFPTIRTALSHGNRFVLTSRDYIWNEAKRPQNLRITDLPVLADGTVVIDLEEMSKDEREQILYNHIKAGDQTVRWKRAAKPFLSRVANHPRFLPETARRLSRRVFTSEVVVTEAGLIQFVAEPKQFLIQSIEQLPSDSQAAICLIFLHGGRVPSPIPEDERFEIVRRYFDATKASLIVALENLRGSFVLHVVEKGIGSWVYKHPTIADAYAAIVGARSEMVEIYLRGAKPETIVTEVVCGDVATQGAAVSVPLSLAKILAVRLSELPDDPLENDSLYTFLLNEIDSTSLETILIAKPELVERKTYVWATLMRNTKLRVQARAYVLGRLPEVLRLEATSRLKDALMEGDGAFLDDIELMNLFTPSEAGALLDDVEQTLVPKLSAIVQEIEDRTNSDEDPSSVYQDLNITLDVLSARYEGNEKISSVIYEVRDEIESAINRLEENRSDPDSDDWNDDAVPASPSSASGRSIFEDIDE